MNRTFVKNYGVGKGMMAIRHCEVSNTDRHEAGCGCTSECEDCLTSAAFESEQNARSYSPFEFFAHDINETGDRAEDLWEAYEEGVAVGIKSGLKERLTQ